MHQDTVRESVLNNKFDDLSSMYHLLVYNTRYPEREGTRSIASPLLFSSKLVTEGDQVVFQLFTCYSTHYLQIGFVVAVGGFPPFDIDEERFF